jgi:hypothetical protein
MLPDHPGLVAAHPRGHHHHIQPLPRGADVAGRDLPGRAQMLDQLPDVVVAERIRRVGRGPTNAIGDDGDAAQRAGPHRILRQRVHIVRRQNRDDRVCARPHGGVRWRPCQPCRAPEDQMHPYCREQPATAVTKPAGGPNAPSRRRRPRPWRVHDPGLLVALRPRLLAHDTRPYPSCGDLDRLSTQSPRSMPGPLLTPTGAGWPGLIHRAGKNGTSTT